jgi:simple sugar transport system permease protein
MTAVTTEVGDEPPPRERRELWVERARALAASGRFTALAIVTALVLGALVIVFTDQDALDAWGRFFRDPGAALSTSWDKAYEAYEALFKSSFGSSRALDRTLLEATPLLFAGLSVALAFRAGLFNIGAAGQLIAGASFAGYVGFSYDLPKVVHLPLALVAGVAGGMVWAGIAGFLKARTGAHEVISTIMLNFIALRGLDYLLSTDTYQRAGRNDPISKVVSESARLPELPGPFGHLGLVLAVAAAVGVWWLLARSTVGFRMRAVGANPNAARTAGMSVAGTYILSMALAGGLAGLAGTSNLLGRESFALSGGFYRQIGFDAIALALVGRSKPGGVVGAALLFGALRAGATGMQAATTTPVDIIVVIQALIIAFVAAPRLVEAMWRIRARQGAIQQFTTGWGAA